MGLVEESPAKTYITKYRNWPRFTNGGVPANHFSYIFIDESGYATETETLIPIAGIISNERNKGVLSGQVILAGDPHQLGPRVHSNFVKYCGFGVSLLERLMTTCEIYARQVIDEKEKYDERFVTKLVQNYRSHASILKISNQLFYDNELVSKCDEVSHIFTKWEYLKKTKFPVIFHNVDGECLRDSNSPSFYNIQEVENVMDYLAKLIGSRVSGRKIQQEDIGIISPYRKQVEKLHGASHKKNWNNLMIGSVEQFQGREKLIIIISTVRSKSAKNLEDFDNKFHLGFLRNPKRFNVAITRPKALLIVVGNSTVLRNDQYWRKFIQYCSENESLAGQKFDLSDDCGYDYEDVIIPTQNVNDVDDGNDGVDFSRGNL